MKRIQIILFLIFSYLYADPGCTDSNACNYDDTANPDDGSCTYVDGVCDTCENSIIVDNDQDGDGVYKIPPSRYIKSTKVSTALALQQRARERMEKWGSSAILRRKDSRVDRARSRLGQELHSPNAHHGGKLTQTEKDEAARNLLQKNFKRDMVNEKFFKDRTIH